MLPPREVVTFWRELTKQEERVLEASMSIDRVKEIARYLGVSVNTIRSQRHSLLVKWQRVYPFAKGGKAGMTALFRTTSSYLIPK